MSLFGIELDLARLNWISGDTTTLYIRQLQLQNEQKTLLDRPCLCLLFFACSIVCWATASMCSSNKIHVH